MSKYSLLQPADCYLHIIDPQENLMKEIYQVDRVVKVIKLMIECSRILDIPALANTQYKKGLGPYVEELEALVQDIPRPDKTEFGAYGNDETLEIVGSFTNKPSTVIMVGVETHICIYQSAIGVLGQGLTPWIVSDGVSSRSNENHLLGLERLRQLGAIIGPAEMIIYELLGKAGTPQFKQVLPHIIEFGKKN